MPGKYRPSQISGLPPGPGVHEFVAAKVDYNDWRVAEANQREEDCAQAGVYNKSSYVRAGIRILNQLLAGPSRQNVLDWLAMPDMLANERKVGLWFRAWTDEEVKRNKDGEFLIIEGRFRDLTEPKPLVKF